MTFESSWLPVDAVLHTEASDGIAEFSHDKSRFA